MPAKNAMVATIRTKWKHNPGCVDIMAQRHLDRRDRSEPSHEQFSELRSRVLGGSRCPQLTHLTERPAYTAAGRILPLHQMLMLSTPVMVIECLHLKHLFFPLRYPCALPVMYMVKLVRLQKQNEYY